MTIHSKYEKAVKRAPRKRAPASASKGRKKGGKPSGRLDGSELEIEQIFDAFHTSVEDIHEALESKLHSTVKTNKTKLSQVKSDSEKSIQQASQKTITCLTMFSHLKSVQAKEKVKTQKRFEGKKRGLKKTKASQSSRADALVQKLQERLNDMDGDSSSGGYSITE
mmetsp:Transcript_15909/g.40543  ORF Transcript_15909/g.40543 Transcript_15909/m.40543 type:complete len:166 (-) Transcript_15909:82-579(-)